MKTHVFRLHPGQDLKQEIDEYVFISNIVAGCILTCVGNLTKAILRMPGAKAGKVEPLKTFEGSFEIVSLVGTVEAGNSHLHISISDDDGIVHGGHLKNGSIVGVTAEIAIGEIENKEFTRILDDKTGYKELTIVSS